MTGYVSFTSSTLFNFSTIKTLDNLYKTKKQKVIRQKTDIQRHKYRGRKPIITYILINTELKHIIPITDFLDFINLIKIQTNKEHM